MDSAPTATQVRDVFDDAVELPRERRGEFLDRTCGEHAALRATVERLLRAHEEASEFLSDPTIPSPAATPAYHDVLPPGARVGQYTLLKLIGEGGCGAVYLARQDPPLARRVAVKVIKPGMDTRQVIARFELERAALARMDHPNIAAVYDAGSTESGRPYFVMELVEGEPITDFSRHFELDLHARLALYAAVCSAVQHAHERGVVHRDLKPANVLVTFKDGNPVPKVIDFGIAKALAPPGQSPQELGVAAAAALTLYPQFLGTPQYMSPEQADLGGEAHVDSRSDVYSLGALLYELLADVPPFDPQQLTSAGLAELPRVLRELEPAAPSVRLANTAKQRASRVRGELDWIVLKAMAKEPQRRYASADALAGDVARYLADEPVAAGPPGFAYRARKFVKRHRPLLATATVALLALLVGIFVSRVTSRAGGTAASLPPMPAIATTSPTTALEPGLLAEIFTGHFDKPVTQRIDPQVHFMWGRGKTPAPQVSGQRFSIRWSGVLVVPSGGASAIGMTADDGGRLYIDGKMLLEFHDPGRRIITQPLQAGRHLIRIEYWNRLAGGHTTLLWQLPATSGSSPVTVPPEALFHAAQDK